MRILELAKRNFKEIVRDRITMAFLLGMPLVFMLIFGFAFGDMETEPLTVGVVTQDQGSHSQQFVGILSQISSLDISLYEETDATEALRIGELSGVLIIPDGFSQAHPILEVFYDEAEIAVAERFVSIINSAAIAFSETTIPVEITSTPYRTEEIGLMNYMGPGMTVFGLLILIPTTAALIARDKERGIMSRLLTTPLKPWQFIAGYSLPYIPVLIIQIAIYLGIAYALGLKIVGNFGLAFLVLFLLGLSGLALGMILGSFVKHEAQAQISWLIIVPMTMLSGAWFPTEGMHSVMQTIAKVFPPTYAISASQDVISRGLGFGAIATDFYALLGFAAVLFVIGAILFRRTMVRG